MIKQWWERGRILFARYRAERLPLATPKFRSTLFVLWLLGLFALGYGRWYGKDVHSQTWSLILSGVGFLGAVTIVLLKNPWTRFKLLFLQILSVLLLFAFGGVAYVTYLILFHANGAVQLVVQLVWIGGLVLLAFITWRVVRRFFDQLETAAEVGYPGVATAPILFMLLVANYVGWWLAR